MEHKALNKALIQGSLARTQGEASATFEIDVVFDLDRLSSRGIRALKAYRDRVVHSAGSPADRVKVLEFREAFQRALIDAGQEAEPVSLGGLEVHQHLVEGLPGVSLILAGSLAHETVEDLTGFFGMTAKTFRGRLKQGHLGLDESERVLRSIRVALAASELFGGFDEAREYLRTKNFALGGARPIDLILTAQGERLVLDELHAQAHSAPL